MLSLSNPASFLNTGDAPESWGVLTGCRLRLAPRPPSYPHSSRQTRVYKAPDYKHFP